MISSFIDGWGVRVTSVSLARNRIISNILLLLLVLHQYGPSYHLSAGSVGVLLLLYFCRERIGRFFPLALAVSFGLTLCYLWVMVRYGYGGEGARIVRYIYCACALIFLYDKFLLACRPSFWLVAAVSIALILFAAVQAFVDRSFQIPQYAFALGENLGIAEDTSIYRHYENSIRVNSIYSEPSVYGMMLVFLFILLSTYRTRASALVSVIVAFAALVSGSALGTFGIIVAVVAVIYSSGSGMNWKNWIPVGLSCGIALAFGAFDIFGGYDFEILNRFDHGVSADESSLARIVKPFQLIWLNVVSGDFLGVAVNVFEHYYWTGLYRDLGDYPGHNGLLSVLIHFGFVGLVILYSLGRSINQFLQLWLFVIIGSQSGNFFSYEKVFLLVGSWALINSLESRRQ